MPHPFDALNLDELRHRDSHKWRQYPPDVLPLWVADMDFPVAPEILRALHERLDRSIGYPPQQGDEDLLERIVARQVALGAPRVSMEGAWFLPGVVPGLYAAVLGLTAPGDEVITHTPIYPPFLAAIAQQNRVVRAAPLHHAEGGWRIDWDAMERAVTPATRLFLLCSPQNPTGRVWTRKELERLAEFTLRHRLWVVVDELHADLRLDGEFIPFASLSPELAERCVTLTGPCKAYNTAGLGIGIAVSVNAALITRMRASAGGLVAYPSTMALEMWRAGLTGADGWLQDVLGYLRGNREFLTRTLRDELPGVRFTPPEATYLAWMDFRVFPWGGRAQQFMLERAKVGLNDGALFGEGFEGFVRLNFATSRAVLSEALERVTVAARSD